MYPAHHFLLFPPFPRDPRVFVAMSFDARFTGRWENVIEPAIGSVVHNSRPLIPFRVDISKVGTSILDDILDGISRSQVILADITTLHVLDGKPVRNANVFYEVGLAHAVRLPEEVLLLRSDKDSLDFDLAPIRVHSYEPDDQPSRAREIVAETLTGILAARDTRRLESVRQAALSLDFISWNCLIDAATKGIPHPPSESVSDALAYGPMALAIYKLLEIGAIASTRDMSAPKRNAENHITAEFATVYRATQFGEALKLHYFESVSNIFETAAREAEAKGWPETASESSEARGT